MSHLTYSLFKSISERNADGVRNLIAQGARINRRHPRTGETPLIDATRQNYPEIVEILLENGALTEVSDENDRMAIHYAAEGSCFKIVKLLVEAGSILDVLDGEERTPLIHAIIEGRCNVVEYLLSKDSTLKRGFNSCNESELTIACSSRDLKVARLLLQYSDNSPENHKELCVVLYRAIKENRGDVVDLLTQHGLNVNDLEQYTHPAMCVAVDKNHALMARYLFFKGAAINSKNKNGDTPLIIASEKGFEEIVDFLLEQGTVVAKVQFLANALNGGAVFSAIASSFTCFAFQGADTTLTSDRLRLDALGIAQKEGHEEIVKKLESANNRLQERSE